MTPIRRVVRTSRAITSNFSHVYLRRWRGRKPPQPRMPHRASVWFKITMWVCSVVWGGGMGYIAWVVIWRAWER